jgi:nitrate reductase gamma subunit
VQEALWVVLPYLSLGILGVGSVLQYGHRPMAWGSRSSQLLEGRWLKSGSLLFHWGIVSVFLGHLLGLLVPVALYHALGVTDRLYHLGAEVLGGTAGLATWAGLDLLMVRRLVFPRVRRTTGAGDWFTLALLWVVVTLGDAETLGRNLLVGPYDYRATVGVWVRELFTFHPQASLMTHVPLLLQAHVVAALVLFAVWPFTRLVHAYSLPLAYLRRAPLQYRARGPRPASAARTPGEV